MDKYYKWVKAYDKYIEALEKELAETSTLAHIHGWTSNRYEEGVQLRDAIEKAKVEWLKEVEPLIINNDYKEPVKWFAKRMEEKLKANDHKGGWQNESFDYLYLRMKKEIQEVMQAYEKKVDAEILINECADVANFAMMIADNLRDKSQSVEPLYKDKQIKTRQVLGQMYNDWLLFNNRKDGNYSNTVFDFFEAIGYIGEPLYNVVDEETETKIENIVKKHLVGFSKTYPVIFTSAVNALKEYAAQFQSSPNINKDGK